MAAFLAMSQTANTVPIFVPVITTIIGGILTAGGGFIANYLLQSSARETERRQFYREQLEHMYLWTKEVVDWMERELEVAKAKSNQGPLDGETKASNELDNPIIRLRMSVDFYFQDKILKDRLRELENFLGAFSKAVDAYSRQANQDHYEEAKTSIHGADDVCRRMREITFPVVARHYI